MSAPPQPSSIDAIDPGTSAPAFAMFLADPDATDALAARLAQVLPGHGVVHLHGDLGAGKSTLARAWLRALGVAGAIRSPTYTLVERYALPPPAPAGAEAVHLDLYRIGDVGELEFLGLDDAQHALWLVEWPSHGGSALPRADLHVELVVEGEGRACRIRSGSARGSAWLALLFRAPGYAHPSD